MHIHTHTYGVHLHKNTQMHLHKHTCMYAYMCTHVNTYIQKQEKINPDSAT